VPGASNDGVCPYYGAGTYCNATPAHVDGTFSSLELVAAYDVCAFEGTTPRCWGTNYYGALGQGTFDTIVHPSPATPNAVTSAAPTVQTFRGDYTHICALDATGSAWCWGTNVRHELGHMAGVTCTSSTKCTATPTKVQSVPALAEIAPGFLFTVALAQDGRVFTWGTNQKGLLGHVPGTMADVDCPAGGDLDATKCNPDPKRVDFP
jgi:alpha-tubulin suppressor-like RCC1 family protein